ncbi:glycosyl hydrolase family 18 protein [Streptomyces sp. NPDC020801]|uniref:glycosyl hydrolase family 18 protein n=1 Tax=unclassified Streptomyces TaxID=2593676 RepID=UPI0037AF41A9
MNSVPRRTRRRATASALITALAAFGLAVGATAPAAHAATPFPAHVFAPYFEAYSGDDPAVVAQNSGAKYLSMAFVQTASAGSCTVYWDGDTSQPIGTTFATSISTIRSRGGDVIPSFGGYTADTTNTEIADSCTSVSSIAAAIENVITKYDLSRVDFDVEQDSLTNSAGIDRRNKAIAQVESWAAANGRHVQFSYTLPTNTDGLDSGGKGVLSNAVANGARIDVVNIMTFDYYTGATIQMANATETAAQGLETYLASLYPSKTSAQLWAMVGVTEMPGIDDYGAAETFTQTDATTVLDWAKSKGINEISMWASERDNGGCPGTAGADSCSGISQPTWYFSNAWAPFTSSGSTGGGNGIVNGGFESGDFTGWSRSGTTSLVTSPVHTGSYAARLGSTSPTNGDSKVSQTFTAPSGNGTVSFDYNLACPDDVSWDWATATLKDNTAGTTTTVLGKTCTLGAGWKKVSAAITAGHSYTLTLVSHDENNPGDATYTLYDDITTS